MEVTRRRGEEQAHLGFIAHLGAELINVDFVEVGKIPDLFPKFGTRHIFSARALQILLLRCLLLEILLHIDGGIRDEFRETCHVDEIECAGGH